MNQYHPHQSRGIYSRHGGRATTLVVELGDPIKTAPDDEGTDAPDTPDRCKACPGATGCTIARPGAMQCKARIARAKAGNGYAA